MSSLIETIATRQRAHSADNAAIRPFRVSVPEAELTDLRRRITATKFPERETVNDMSQGVPLATVEKLARYWATEYDWRKVEARLNALPQFISEIDGLDIHFIHVRSKHEKALPIIVSHGWPGSFIEQLKIIGPLSDPTAFGGRASDAFDVVIPSMPGFGFSGKPTTTGWDPVRIARAWIQLQPELTPVPRTMRPFGMRAEPPAWAARAASICSSPTSSARNVSSATRNVTTALLLRAVGPCQQPAVKSGNSAVAHNARHRCLARVAGAEFMIRPFRPG